MNNTDEFLQVVDNQIPKFVLRSDLHWLQLTLGKDLWYLGGELLTIRYSVTPDVPPVDGHLLRRLEISAPTGRRQQKCSSKLLLCTCVGKECNTENLSNRS